MCRRFFIFTYDEVLDIVRKIEMGAPLNINPDWPAGKLEACPKSVAPLIVPTFDTSESKVDLAPGSLTVRELSWGFEESWKPGVIFNTRIDSAMKSIWRESMEHRRCIIPAAGFFETHREETYPSPKTGKPIKRQYEFRVPDQDAILIGGVWRDGSFSMVTTDANRDMAPMHHRMPLILRQEELPLWFSSDYRQLADRSKIRLESQPVN